MVDDRDEQHPMPPADGEPELTGKATPETSAPGSADPASGDPDAGSAPGSNPPDQYAVTTYVPPEPEVQFADRVHRTPEEHAASHERRRRRRRRRKIVGWAMLGAGTFILLIGAWVGWRSYQAYSHLQNASTDVATLQDQLQDITTVDPTATAATVEHLQSESAAARAAVSDPVYRMASVLPFVGANLDAIRDVTLTVDSLATDVMPSLVDVAQTLQPAQLAPKDGAIDLAPIQRISPLLQKADAAVTEARATMAAIDRTAVVQPVGDAVLTLRRKLDQAADATGPGARVARLLPPMLGADGPRTYLIGFQNSAEPRATGGIFGSYAVIKADRGKITILDQGASSRSLGIFSPPVAQLAANQINLYTNRMAKYPADVNLTPDFPTAARLFAEMYRVRSGTTVDGVLAIDPIALSYLLKGSNPIDVGEGVKVTSDNLVPILLSTAYEKFDEVDQSQRDTFLADATSKVFSKVMTGDSQPRSIVSGLRKAADERRVLIYSAKPDEQADIATTGISGAINADLAAPSVGVFLNDGTGAKLGYYLTSEAHVTQGDCQPDGRRELLVKVVMHYDAPASGLPPYVTGTSALGRQGILRTNVLVFAPTGGGVVGATAADGAALVVGKGEDHARQVGQTTVELSPGTSTELTFTVFTAVDGDGVTGDVQPTLQVTPGVTPWVTSVDTYRECRVTVN